ncbi:hypothetical protein PROPEN_00951 [Proteus penneri ATCC 35198]|nr:hypothetical protein PROPEN_00951 [Proteus penneri ATCC 35198]
MTHENIPKKRLTPINSKKEIKKVKNKKLYPIHTSLSLKNSTITHFYTNILPSGKTIR